MKRKPSRSSRDPSESDVKNDSDPDMFPTVKPIEIKPVAIGDDVYDPRSDNERFPMPEDLPQVEKADETRDT